MMVLLVLGGAALIGGAFAFLLRAVVSSPVPGQQELPAELGGDLSKLELLTPCECRRELRALLRRVRSDYGSLESAAKALMLTSPVDRPDLTRALVRSRMKFELAMAGMRIQMALNAIGVSPVRTGALVRSVAGIRTVARAAISQQGEQCAH